MRQRTFENANDALHVHTFFFDAPNRSLGTHLRDTWRTWFLLPFALSSQLFQTTITSRPSLIADNVGIAGTSHVPRPSLYKASPASK